MGAWRHFWRRTVIRRLRIILTVRPEAAEVWSGLYGVLLGAWLLLPMATFPTASGYSRLLRVSELLGMSGHLSEMFWGATMLAIGGAQLCTVANQTRGRQIVAMLAAVWWCWVALEIYRGNPTSLGVPAYALVAVSNLWLVARLEVLRHVD